MAHLRRHRSRDQGDERRPNHLRSTPRPPLFPLSGRPKHPSLPAEQRDQLASSARTTPQPLLGTQRRCHRSNSAWDERILELPQGYLGMSDYSPAGGWHSNFPVFTRQHLETFETLFHPMHWGWIADQWICKTYTAAARRLPLGIHILHHQADQLRQRAIFQHQPDGPSDDEQQRWAHIIAATSTRAEEANGSNQPPQPNTHTPAAAPILPPRTWTRCKRG